MSIMDLYNAARISGVAADNKLQTRQMELMQEAEDIRRKGKTVLSWREFNQQNKQEEPSNRIVHTLKKTALFGGIGAAGGALLSAITGGGVVPGTVVLGGALGGGTGLAMSLGDDLENEPHRKQLDKYNEYLTSVSNGATGTLPSPGTPARQANPAGAALPQPAQGARL